VCKIRKCKCTLIEFLYQTDIFSIQFFFTNSIEITELKNLFNYPNQISISIQHFCIKLMNASINWTATLQSIIEIDYNSNIKTFSAVYKL
jgi:hypothetical protein